MTFGQEYLTHLRVIQNIGMARIDPIIYNGVEIVPIQFLKAVLPDPKSLGANYHGQTSIGCRIRGIKDGKEREVERKLFPGYVLVKMVMTDDSWYIVRNTRGVTGFVGPSSKPIPLTDEEVDKLGVDVREVSLDYAVGDNVQIMNGPLEGFIGIVEGIDTDAKKVNVKVSMFGRETPAELDFTQVKPL